MITHPEKVLFPDDGITKGDLASYYEAIAPFMLPHICGRPVTMERYHRGIGAPGFFQKDVAVDADVWHRVRIGPITKLDNLNKLRKQLQAADVDALVIRVGD